jgi:hypothetical protein
MVLVKVLERAFQSDETGIPRGLSASPGHVPVTAPPASYPSFVACPGRYGTAGTRLQREQEGPAVPSKGSINCSSRKIIGSFSCTCSLSLPAGSFSSGISCIEGPLPLRLRVHFCALLSNFTKRTDKNYKSIKMKSVLSVNEPKNKPVRSPARPVYPAMKWECWSFHICTKIDMVGQAVSRAPQCAKI